MPDDSDAEIHDECYEPFEPDDEEEETPRASDRLGSYSVEEALAEASQALDEESDKPYVSHEAETTAGIRVAIERGRGAPYYFFDYDAGGTYRTDPGGKKNGDDLTTLVFRFRLEVVSIMAAAPEGGADAKVDPAAPWVVRLEVLGREPSEHVMDVKARESKHKAAAWLAGAAPWCVIEHAKESHFLQALKESAAFAPITIMPDHMGWFKHPDKGWVHLAPGRKWGISERGIEPTLYFEKRLLGQAKDMFDKKVARYGALVKPSASMQEVEEAKEALRNVILCAPRAVTVPWLAANMLAPLRTTVLQTDVPTMMLLGKTGARKTSLSNAVASLFGRFSATTDRRGASVASWSNTYAPLSRLLYLCGDHPLVIQDYKKTANKDAVTLIQGITDNAGSQRATRDGTLRQGSSVNAMVLATGEQSFAEEESTASRVFELVLGANDIDNEILARVQHAAQVGIMQRLGGDYLKWIAASGILDDDTFEKEREAATRWLAPRVAGQKIHDGVIQTGVVMLTGLRIIALFADYYHDAAFTAEIRGYLREGADAILQRTLARGRAAADLSEVHRFFEAFVSALYVQDDYYSKRHDQRNDFEDEYLPGGRHTPGNRANGIARHAYAAADTAHANPIFFISEKQTFDAWFAHAYPQTTLTWASLKAEIMDLVPGAWPNFRKNLRGHVNPRAPNLRPRGRRPASSMLLAQWGRSTLVRLLQ